MTTQIRTKLIHDMNHFIWFFGIFQTAPSHVSMPSHSLIETSRSRSIRRSWDQDRIFTKSISLYCFLRFWPWIWLDHQASTKLDSWFNILRFAFHCVWFQDPGFDPNVFVTDLTDLSVWSLWSPWLFDWSIDLTTLIIRSLWSNPPIWPIKVMFRYI